MLLGVFTLVTSLLLPGQSGAQQSPEIKTNIPLRLSPGPDLSADAQRIRLLLRVADSLWSIQPDTARILAARARDLSTRIGYKLGIAHALNTIGVCMQARGLHDSAIAFFDEGLRYARASGTHRNRYRLYDNLATSYFNLGRYSKALEHYYLALNEMEQNRSAFRSSDSIALYVNIGNLWCRMGGYEQSKAVLNQAWKVAVRTRDSAMQIAIWARFGEAEAQNGDAAAARNYYLKALQMTIDYDQPKRQAEILNSLAHFYLDQQDPDGAYSYIKDAVDLERTHPGKFPYDRLHTFHNLGHYYLQQKSYDKAELMLTRTLADAAAGGYKEMLPHIEPELAALYAATGRYQLAYEHMRRYAGMQDTMRGQERLQSLDVWVRSLMDEKNKKLMSQQLFISRQHNAIQSRNFLVAAIIAGALFVTGLMIAFLRSYRHKQRLQQSEIAHLQQQQEISQLKAQVRGEEQERNRLARELHDGIASRLWAIKLNVDHLKQQQLLSDPGQRELQLIYNHLDDTTTEVRKTAHNLMPDLLLEEGLPAVLASFCERLRKQTELQEIDFMEYGAIPRLDPEIEISLYRMIQELIQNVLKHAKRATSLLVQLSCNDTLLNITVEDNGEGFPVATASDKPGEGLGLRHIRKRVLALQGHMDVQSTIGKGTTVYLEFDIRNLL
ncbi:tetratricopeptide repeat-containing sensor histidine kinase [Taibaiella helva]|uniref:tetratricopeptide repeat-containing sensor histidine kinase n=1 Tax=Taibaiella helva TaxID=2301235 RepID=UPI0018E51789|nr:tetratricopeptide repeat protein [Taibaiella helva]